MMGFIRLVKDSIMEWGTKEITVDFIFVKTLVELNWKRQKDNVSTKLFNRFSV